ncbi:UDP-N-acetylglucosamine 2-epimerase [Paractinoplanes atraurantiacus]|uniref:UDP-N-acetylglucosamine 2-epimerase (non-hydrolyzing) n=1 Tax=Paractinoplanes atraurantiacus TaxID=1036182 RepID=A0A285EYD9_9ACTN|nr:UDP-N-acetylglucosamine 2-epimerase [Actinoplanes atraurantiacus]SNY04037.1 UDP-N-acetylglucosamine 2-epimerase (non-hydrolysing) [Actinoplanes atraurantiacus]
MSSLPEVHLVAGTPAEAFRLAPVVLAMREQGRLTPVLLTTGSDTSAVDAALGRFHLTPKITLPAAGTPTETIRRFDELWAGRTPDAVVVRDDLPAALAAFWRRIPIMQLDAGRRDGDLVTASARETQRRLLAQVATVHLAATPLAAMNLLDERVVAGDLLLTGGTAADAAARLLRRRPHQRLVVLGVPPERAQAIGPALRYLATRHPDLEVVGPDQVRTPAEAYVVVTDDGDLLEESLAFGTPVLAIAEGTEYSEALHAGSVRLVAADPATVTSAVAELLDSRVRRDAMAAGGNPYGDGLAAKRVAQATAALLGHGQFPDPMPARPVAGVAR